VKVRVSDILASIDHAFPAAWAEPWDQVGLLVGDPATVVTGVRVALDPTHAEIAATLALGANVLVTHHPAFLESPQTVTASTGTDGIAFAAAAKGISLIAAHTNLDRAPDGAASLPRALGLEDGYALESSLQPIDLITVYAPTESEAAILAALFEAGAGRIGEYRGCSFSSTGQGSFVEPLPSEVPDDAQSSSTSVDEIRIEVVAPRGKGARIASIAARIHPYEEPVVSVTETAIVRGAARLGRVCELAVPCTLETVTSGVADRLSCVPRVWGSPSTSIASVACATGSGGSLIDSAIAAGCDALIAGEVRYHDALNAIERGLCIIEAGHDVTEWPLVSVLASAVAETPGLMSSHVSLAPSGRGWWTP